MRLKTPLDLFARDMDKVSKFAIRFLDKYSAGGSGLEFAKDFGRFYITLQTRMRKEEGALYKGYINLKLD